MSSLSCQLVVGLEVHAQLKTQSKLFCGCSTKFSPEAPNTQTCPVCLGLPGALPVMNRTAFQLAVQTGLALNCTIAEFTKWDRKQYYYPDLPKAYQISQFDLPFSSHGHLEIDADDPDSEPRRIRILRAHLEEDAGKNMHDESGGGGDSRVDLNRTGTPLLEIVSEPDLRSAAEARRYLEDLRALLLFLGVSDCNMQEGSLRCDANVNLHIQNEDGSVTATPIVELKNMNSFRNVELAIEYEAKRQVSVWKKTKQQIGDVPKQTRGWDAERGVTFGQREKEESSDYRYFPDPDLVPVTLTASEIEDIRRQLPETPRHRRQRFVSDMGLKPYDAAVIVDQGPAFTQYFEQVAAECKDGKTAANWMTQDVLRDLNAAGITPAEFELSPSVLAEILKNVLADRITTKGAREVYSTLRTRAADGAAASPDDVEQVIQDCGLEVVNDTAAIQTAIDAAIAARPAAVDDFKAGKQAAVGPLIGMVMKQVSGADPKTVRGMIIATIESS
jgi:aspartyl-tRNA(Asn)/glutamyl-tRNA(Gln) amidotransferase subunit B